MPRSREKQEEPLVRRLTDQEILEGREEGEREIRKMTEEYLKNATSEALKNREEGQKKLKEFLETASKEEKEYSESVKRGRALSHRDWARAGFEKVTTLDANLGVPAIIVLDYEGRSDELNAQQCKSEEMRKKIAEKKACEIENLLKSAYPEYLLRHYPHEGKERGEKKESEKEFNPMYG